MTPHLAEYIQAGHMLTPDERREAGRMLHLSVGQDTEVEQADIDAEWGAVIERRVEKVLSGEVQAISGRASFARIRTRLD